ncbi:MAG: hypothetical protein ACE5MB_06620 [Anaerolineae bacterium]
MIEFLQAYGSWILFGLFFLVLMRMHGSRGGMGCGMGGHQHQAEEDQETPADDGNPGNGAGCH